MDRTMRQKFNKEIEDFKNTVNALDLTDIYGTYTLFSNICGAFSSINY
jgi:hypothetical protein